MFLAECPLLSRPTNHTLQHVNGCCLWAKFCYQLKVSVSVDE